MDLCLVEISALAFLFSHGHRVTSPVPVRVFGAPASLRLPQRSVLIYKLCPPLTILLVMMPLLSGSNFFCFVSGLCVLLKF